MPWHSAGTARLDLLAELGTITLSQPRTCGAIAFESRRIRPLTRAAKRLRRERLNLVDRDL
jgi:hypothetical protein